MTNLNDSDLNNISGGLITGDGATIFEANDVFFDKRVPNTSYKVTTRTVIRSLAQAVPVDITNAQGTVSGTKPASYLLNSCTRSK